MNRRTLLRSLASLPLLGWLRPVDSTPPNQQLLEWADDLPDGACCCCDCIDLPAIGESNCTPLGPAAISDGSRILGWIVPVMCPDCRYAMRVATGDDRPVTCGECGAEWIATVRYSGEPHTLSWHLDPPAP